ncbi:hypothetical protein D3C86_1247170 [compost metagenome]
MREASLALNIAADFADPRMVGSAGIASLAWSCGVPEKSSRETSWLHFSQLKPMVSCCGPLSTWRCVMHITAKNSLCTPHPPTPWLRASTRASPERMSPLEPNETMSSSTSLACRKYPIAGPSGWLRIEEHAGTMSPAL